MQLRKSSESLKNLRICQGDSQKKTLFHAYFFLKNSGNSSSWNQEAEKQMRRL